jgi:integrase
LRRTTDSYRDELIVRLGGEVGLRSFEIPQITPAHPRREVIEDDSYHFLRVPEGKDTTASGGKPRDAYLPRSVERDLHRYHRAEDIGDDDSYIDVSPRHLQRIVKRTAEQTAERTGDDDFRKVSSHDLRRYFAHTCLVEKKKTDEPARGHGNRRLGGLRSTGAVPEQAESEHYRCGVQER